MAEKDLADINQDVNDLKIQNAIEFGKIYTELGKIKTWMYFSAGTSSVGVVAQIIDALKN